MTQFEKNQLLKNAVWQGTLSLMVLRTLLTMGEQHGYGIARRIEQTSQGRLSINYGTLYPALLKLEQEGLIASEWGVSDNNRKAKFYKLTRAGRKQIERDTKQWEETNAIMTRLRGRGLMRASAGGGVGGAFGSKKLNGARRS
jgi:transcriptional regulator